MHYWEFSKESSLGRRKVIHIEAWICRNEWKSTGKPKYVGAWKQWLPAVCIMYKEVYGNSGIKGDKTQMTWSRRGRRNPWVGFMHNSGHQSETKEKAGWWFREKRASAAVGSLFLLPFLDVTYLTTWVRPPFPQLPCLHSQEPCSPQLNTEPGWWSQSPLWAVAASFSCFCWLSPPVALHGGFENTKFLPLRFLGEKNVKSI